MMNSATSVSGQQHVSALKRASFETAAGKNHADSNDDEEVQPKKARLGDGDPTSGLTAPRTPSPRRHQPQVQSPTVATTTTPAGNRVQTSNNAIQNASLPPAVMAADFQHLLASGPLFNGGSQAATIASQLPQHPLFPGLPPIPALDPAALQALFATRGLPLPHPPPFGAYPRPDAMGPMNFYLDPAGFHHFGPIDPGRRKNATREVTLPLKNWLLDHKKNPYPTKPEKTLLAIMSKMSMTQVSTWFANARRRLKKENKMTWSPRNRAADDNDEEEEEQGYDNDRRSSIGSQFSVTVDQKADQVEASSYTDFFGHNGSPPDGASSADPPPKKREIWSIADTLSLNGAGQVVQQPTTFSSPSAPGKHNESAPEVNGHVKEASCAPPSSSLLSQLGGPTPLVGFGIPQQLAPTDGVTNAHMMEAFAAAFTAFMGKAMVPPIPTPNNAAALATAPTPAGGPPFHMMPALVPGVVPHSSSLKLPQGPLMGLPPMYPYHPGICQSHNQQQQQQQNQMTAMLGALTQHYLRNGAPSNLLCSNGHLTSGDVGTHPFLAKTEECESRTANPEELKNAHMTSPTMKQAELPQQATSGKMPVNKRKREIAKIGSP